MRLGFFLLRPQRTNQSKFAINRSRHRFADINQCFFGTTDGYSRNIALPGDPLGQTDNTLFIEMPNKFGDSGDTTLFDQGKALINIAQFGRAFLPQLNTTDGGNKNGSKSCRPDC